MTFKISPKHRSIVSSLGNVSVHLIWSFCNEAYGSFDAFPFSGIKVDRLWCISCRHLISHNSPDILIVLFVCHSLPPLWRSLPNYLKACKSLNPQSTFSSPWVGQSQGIEGGGDSAFSRLSQIFSGSSDGFCRQNLTLEEFGNKTRRGSELC